MTAINPYATLQDVKDWLTTPGQTMTAATVDDTVIDLLLTAASRYIDNKCGRTFYPRIETRYYDVPEGTLDDRILMLDDDLLAVTTLTNGDTTVITSADYKLYPMNFYPKYAIRLKQNSDYYWERDSNENSEGVISVLGIWGCHPNYSQLAWGVGSTLNEGGLLTAADLTWTMTAVTAFEAGQIVKIENELCIIASVGATDIVVIKRGANGSTAATHADTTAVTIWVPPDDIKQACLEITVSTYKRRWGENVSGVATVTAAGVVVTPQDVPSGARDIIASYRRVSL